MNRSTARLSALDHDHAATQMEPSIQPIDNYRAQPEGVDERPGVQQQKDTKLAKHINRQRGLKRIVII